MAILLEATKARLGSTGSVIGFEPVKEWSRYLTLDGKRAYHLGGICNTCSFLFERLQGANQSVTVAEVADELASGLSSLGNGVVNSWARALPEGEYVTCLFEADPMLVTPGSDADYFSREQVDLWGVDPFWGMPHHPRTEYYRVGSTPIGEAGSLFQFVVPMFPKNWLEPADISRYAAALERGERPTAVAISVLEFRQPAMWEEGDTVTEHWCLAHYLLDGHHKTFAAAQAGARMTLLSFLAVGEGTASDDQIRDALQVLRQE